LTLKSLACSAPIAPMEAAAADRVVTWQSAAHQRDEITEQRNRIVWSGRGFGMELHAECAMLA
jgi:hypothetical protein